MNTRITALALSACLAATGVAVTAAAEAKTGSAPAKVASYTPDQLVSKFGCVNPNEDGATVSDIAYGHHIGSLVYAIRKDRTAVVNSGTTPQYAALMSSEAGDWTPSLRFVCTKKVPASVIVRWS